MLQAAPVCFANCSVVPVQPNQSVKTSASEPRSLEEAGDLVSSKAPVLEALADRCRRPMHVVVVDEELPYPPNSGKRIRTLNLLLPLAKRHHLTYLCYSSSNPGETQAAVQFFRQNQIETVLVDRRLPDKEGAVFYGRLLWNLFSHLPYSVQVHNSQILRNAIRQYAATHHVDLWHCEWSPYGHSVEPCVTQPWIVMAHNVESLIWQRLHEHESNCLKRWYIKHQWRKFERF